jgi:hypothetical protein
MHAVEVGKALPAHPSYDDDVQARKFWRASFRAGRKYQDATDSRNKPILIQHERESKADYDLRKRTTPVRDYTGTIIRRYNDFVFRREPQIEADGAASEFAGDVDGRGTSAVQFFRRRLKVAQVDGIAFVLAEARNVSAPQMTIAQARAAGARQVLVPIDADAVIDWERYDGSLLAARVMLSDQAGNYCMEYDANGNRRRIEITKAANWWTVEAIGPWEATGYGMLPLVDLWPSFDDLGTDDVNGHGESQASPIAEAQRAVYNITSLLSAEMYDNTFTQHVLFGADDSQFSAGTDREPSKRDPAVDWGTKRLLCMPDPAGKLEKAGSDVAQADSLRATIAAYEDALYMAAGVSNQQQMAQAQSGIALAFRNNDLSATLSALASAVEGCFRRCMSLVAGVAGGEPAAIALSDDYEPGDFAQELQSVISAMMTPALPGTFKRRIAQRFATRHFPDLSDDDVDLLEGEIDAIGGMGLISTTMRAESEDS